MTSTVREEPYEVLAIRYASRMTRRAEVFLNYHYYGEDDAPTPIDYYFWVIRNAERTIVVDTGYGIIGAENRNRGFEVHPVEALARLGITAAEVPTLILTHCHFDHIGNVDAFETADVVLTERELSFWNSPIGKHRMHFCKSTEDHDLSVLNSAVEQGRLRTVGMNTVVAPGVELIQLGGHTPGTAVVVVHTGGRRIVLASDAVHFYEEIEQDRPFAVVSDLEEMYQAFDTLRGMVDEGAELIAGHDPKVADRYPLNAEGTAFVIAELPQA